jgi:hypothetical protein
MNVWYKYRCINILLGYIFLFFLKINTLQAQQLNCSNNSGSYIDVLYRNFSQDRFNYASEIDYKGQSITLYADIYKPITQSNIGRATIIIFTGGGFKNTYITAPILKAWAKEFTSRGYNVIIPMYRTGWLGYDIGLCGSGSTRDFEDAMYRALQDEKLLLEYLNKNMLRWQIDTSKIFEMGYSAGALLVLGNIGGEDVLFTEERIMRLGTMPDPQLSVKGIITLTGAILNRTYKSGIPPLLLFHGSCDNAVPLEDGRLAGCANLSYLYGSSTIYEDLKDNNCVQLQVFCNYGHDFRNGNDVDDIASAFSYISDISSNFMYDVMCDKYCSALAITANDSISAPTLFSCHPNVGNKYCKIWNNADDLISIAPTVLHADYSIKILSQSHIAYPNAILIISDLCGKIIFEKMVSLDIGNSTTVVTLPHYLQKGIYNVFLYHEKEIIAHEKLLQLSK